MADKIKKAAAILGSPHKKGTTAVMLDCAVKGARSAGWKVEEINLYEENIAFCKGCRKCLETGECVQRDSIQRLAALFRECDAVILAAPVYWANVPAAVKNMFDRLLGTAMAETGKFPKPLLPGKQYILLTACNTPFPFSWLCGQSRGTIRAMNEFFKTAGMKCAGKFVCSDTGRKKALSEKTAEKISKSVKLRLDKSGLVG